MAQLAIKGHPTRGREVIQLLEMLGGKSDSNMNGYNDDLYYYIAKDGLIYGSGIEYEELACKYLLFTLEEFEGKYPYKVGDKVLFGDLDKDVWTIESMSWNQSMPYDDWEVEYIISDSHKSRLCGIKAKHLKPYKEETNMKEIKSIDLNKLEQQLDEALAKETPESLNKWLDEENMEKRLEPVYELGTGKILYYVEKVSGEKYCPIGETTLYIQDGYEFRDETNNVINAKRITLVRKQPQYPKTLEKLVEPKFKVGDIITKRDSIENSWVVSSVSSEYYGLQLPKGSEGIGTLPIIDQDKYELIPNKFDIVLRL